MLILIKKPEVYWQDNPSTKIVSVYVPAQETLKCLLDSPAVVFLCVLLQKATACLSSGWSVYWQKNVLEA